MSVEILCTNPDCKAIFNQETSHYWIFIREKLFNGKYFQLNLCDKCFKKMRKDEDEFLAQK